MNPTTGASPRLCIVLLSILIVAVFGYCSHYCKGDSYDMHLIIFAAVLIFIFLVSYVGINFTIIIDFVFKVLL